MKRLLLGLTLLSVLAGVSRANPWYVATDGDGSDGLTWATAWQDPQTAIDAAGVNDTIYVKGEVFTLSGNNPPTGKLYWGPTRQGLTIIGGYAGIGPEPGPVTNAPTVFYNADNDGQNSHTNRILYIDAVTNGTLSNVTIRGGRVGDNGWDPSMNMGTEGAGLYLASCTNLLLSGLVIEQNAHQTDFSQINSGGGVFASNSWGTITNCIIRENAIIAKRGTSRGAGIYIEGGAWTLRDCIIRDNAMGEFVTAAYFDGGGLYINGGTHLIKNVLLSRNGSIPEWPYGHGTGSAPAAGRLDGAAVYVAAGTVTMENCTAYWHDQEGIALAGGSLTIRDSIIWDCGDDIVGSPTLEYCNIEDGDGDATCMSSDPLFERGLYLHADSPSVNTGSRSAAAAGLSAYTTRADGTAEGATTVDMGYHFTAGVQDYYVSVDDGDDGNAGTSPGSGNAFQTITKALSLITDGGHVHVAAGHYTAATEDLALTVRHTYGVQILGAGREVTILDGQSANAQGIHMSHNYPDARVEGLTITGIRMEPGTTWPDGSMVFGGGLYVVQSRGVVVDLGSVTNYVGTENDAAPARPARRGTGMYLHSCDLVVTNCVVANNYLDSWRAEPSYGAGIYAVNAGLIVNTVVSANTNECDAGSTVHAYGGGLYLMGTGLRNSVIVNNEAFHSGSGYGYGDGIYVADGTVAIETSTITDNAGEGLRRAGTSTVSVENSILWGNTVDVTGTVTVAWSNVEVADPAATLNDTISADPLFLDAPAGDYRLQVKGDISPSVNTGNPTPQAWMLAGVDLDGNDRILNDRVDQGAYENLVPPPGSLILLR